MLTPCDGDWRTAMIKTVVGPGVGKEKQLFKESEDVKEQAHSKTVAVEMPGYKRVYVSGHVAAGPNGEIIGTDDIEEQTRVTLEQIEAHLDRFGGDMNDIVRVRVYVTDLNNEDFRALHKVRGEFFDRNHHPASTLVEVGALAIDDALIEIDADAIIPEDGWDETVVDA